MKNRKFLITVFITIGICLFAGCFYKIFTDKQAENKYLELKNRAAVQDTQDNIIDETQTSELLSEAGSFEFTADITPDWDYLFSLNTDICAWIHMAPNISYPVTFCGDNSFYLDHSFDKSYSRAGCIFINAGNHSDFTDRNTILYGHNMRNRSMFGSLKYYKDSSYVEKYPYIYIYLPSGYVYTYEIFNVFIGADGSAPYDIMMDSDSDMQEYIDNLPVIQKNIISSSAYMITLSTCAGINSSQRLIVQAVRISAEPY